MPATFGIAAVSIAGMARSFVPACRNDGRFETWQMVYQQLLSP